MKKSRLLRLFLVPVLTLAISIAAIEVCISVAERRIVQMIDEEVILGRDNLSYSLKQYIESAASIEYGFASSFCSLDSSGVFRLLKSERRGLTPDIAYEKMRSFLSVYPDFDAAYMIFEKGILAECDDDSFAGGIWSSDINTWIDLREYFDPFNSKLYRRGIDTLCSNYYSPIMDLSVDDSPSSVHVIPIYDDKDGLVGEIWFKYNLEWSGTFFSSFRQCQDSPVFLVDQDVCKVDMSNIPNSAGKPVLPLIDSLSGGAVSTLDDYFITEAIYYGIERTFTLKRGRERYRVYVSELEGHNLSFVQILSESQIYKSINEFKCVLLLLSVIAILAVFLLSTLSFRKLYESESENISVHREMKIASGLQEHLLPPSLPEVPEARVEAVQRQAQLVGGDLYDCRVRRGKMLVCVGDVSGKGMPACMYMSMVSSHLRAQFETTSDPSAIMNSINDAICDRNATMMFCTMFLGVLDLQTGELEFCNAGHDRPALGTSEGWSFLEMVKNVPIGIEPGFNFVSQKLTLAPSDSLFIYTDGVTEARSSTGDLYGEARLLDLLGHYGPSSVLSDIDKFSIDAPQADDITMLRLTFKGKSE